MNAYNGPPMTLGNAAAAHVRLIVWCLDCCHQVEADLAEGTLAASACATDASFEASVFDEIGHSTTLKTDF